MSEFLKKGPTDCWPWLDSADTAPNRDSRMACANPMCCNPRHVVEITTPAKLEDDEQEEIVLARETLIKAKVTVDGRWGLERLLEEVAKLPVRSE